MRAGRLSALFGSKTFPETGISLKRFVVAYGDGKSFRRADKDDEPFSARYRSIEQVSLEQEVVLSQDRHDDDGIFTSL